MARNPITKSTHRASNVLWYLTLLEPFRKKINTKQLAYKEKGGTRVPPSKKQLVYNLVGYFHQPQLLAFTPLRYFHNVHTRTIVDPYFNHGVDTDVTLYFHEPSFHIKHLQYSQLVFTTFYSYSEPGCTWVWCYIDTKGFAGCSPYNG
jgi:hypothetical protein